MNIETALIIWGIFIGFFIGYGVGYYIQTSEIKEKLKELSP